MLKKYLSKKKLLTVSDSININHIGMCHVGSIYIAYCFPGGVYKYTLYGHKRTRTLSAG